MKKTFIKLLQGLCLGLCLAVVVSLSTQAQQVKFDLANLRQQDRAITASYDQIRIQEAWEFVNRSVEAAGTFLPKIVIGIPDSGVDAAHPEFFGTVLFNNVFGRVDLNHTPEFLKRDFIGHGTAVSGIIGANNISRFLAISADSPQMNGIVSGINKLEYTLAIRETPGRSADQIASVLNDLIDAENVRILNFSFGLVNEEIVPNTLGSISSGTFDELTNFFTDYVSKRRDVLFVAGGGNDGVDVKHFFPANTALTQANVMAVAATDNDKRAKFFDEAGNLIGESNFGAGVNVSAPGVGVYAPAPNNQYARNFQGTSAAAPMVTGVAGILRSLMGATRPDLAPQDFPSRIKTILARSADPIRTGEGIEKQLGNACFTNPSLIPSQQQGETGCRLNALHAIQTVTPFYDHALDLVSINGNIQTVSGCDRNLQGQFRSFFDDFTDGLVTAGCTANLVAAGTIRETDGFLTMKSSEGVPIPGCRPTDGGCFSDPTLPPAGQAHFIQFNQFIRDGSGNATFAAALRPDFTASLPFPGNYGIILNDNFLAPQVSALLATLNIGGRMFLTVGTRIEPTVFRTSVLDLSRLSSLIIGFSLNDANNTILPFFSLDGGQTFHSFLNPDGTTFSLPFFTKNNRAVFQVFTQTRKAFPNPSSISDFSSWLQKEELTTQDVLPFIDSGFYPILEMEE